MGAGRICQAQQVVVLGAIGRRLAGLATHRECILGASEILRVAVSIAVRVGDDAVPGSGGACTAVDETNIMRSA